jgi:uncharacterized protein (TIGR03435 family)
MNEIFNHLWQSTAFTVVIALASMAFRRNSPRLRYWLWLAASVKFLIPFSLIVSTGARVQLPPETLSPRAATVAQITTYFEPVPELSAAVPGRPGFSWVLALSTIWLIGVLLLLFRWFRRWRTIHRVVRRAIRLPLLSSVPIFSSPTKTEPGVFGLFRPVLVLPEGIADRLTPKQFEAILAHELRHIRCFDNLTAAVHMGVETLFWFHPLVWWIGARLMHERERDCDEAVLRQGSQPGDYARGIVYVCETYVETQLPCAPGISGSDLKRRVREIMTWRRSLPVRLRGKAILALTAIAAVSVPFGIGVMRAQTRLEFAAVSIRANAPGSRVPTFFVCHGADGKRQALPSGPNQFTAPRGRCVGSGASLPWLIGFAYGLPQRYVRGGPDWIRGQGIPETFQVEAAAEDPATTTLEQLAQMLQTMLADRFKLKLHRETQELPGYALVVAKKGPKLKQVYGEEQSPLPVPNDRGELTIKGTAKLSALAQILSSFSPVFSPAGEVVPIADKTGITGVYDLEFVFPDQPTQRAGRGSYQPAASDISSALEDQLGLRIEAQKISVDVVVIDEIEHPSPN